MNKHLLQVLLVEDDEDDFLLTRELHNDITTFECETEWAEAFSAAKRERAMIENALDVICTIDAEGRFVTVNPACFRMWGYQPAELIE